MISSLEPRVFDSPAQEEQYKGLIAELRCLVCQNQNIADSDADLAKDLRRETYKMVREGKGEQEIIDFMVQRYGDFVLYRPPLKSTTYLLWLAPALLVLLGLSVLVIFVRRNRKESSSGDLSDEERRKLNTLVKSRGGDTHS